MLKKFNQYKGNGCHRAWDLGRRKDSIGGVCITSRFKLSEDAIRKDGVLKKAFRVHIASALLGHEDSERWLEERGCSIRA